MTIVCMPFTCSFNWFTQRSALLVYAAPFLFFGNHLLDSNAIFTAPMMGRTMANGTIQTSNQIWNCHLNSNNSSLDEWLNNVTILISNQLFGSYFAWTNILRHTNHMDVTRDHNKYLIKSFLTSLTPVNRMHIHCPLYFEFRSVFLYAVNVNRSTHTFHQSIKTTNAM